MKIFISGSMRFKEEMMKLAENIRYHYDYEVIEPSSVPHPMSDKPVEQAENKFYCEFYIKQCNQLLVFNKNDYIGFSTTTEIEFAIIYKIPVIFLFTTNNLDIKMLITSPYLVAFIDDGDYRFLVE